MALIATYVSGAVAIENAYLRIQRLWGSKEEGWGAWVAVYRNRGDSEHVELFNVSAAYESEKNPFKSLYEAVKSLPSVVGAKDSKEYRKDYAKQVPDTTPEPVAEAQQEEQQEQPKKRGRSKKN